MAGRYAAPFSFVGSAHRIARWPQSVEDPTGKALAWVGAIVVVIMAWSLIVGWYLVALMFAGPWLLFYRLVRRGQRRRADVANALRRIADR